MPSDDTPSPHEDDAPEPGRSASAEPDPAPASKSWLASDRVQALANVLTVIVALTAIGLSIWQGYENRVSNRLSVIPNLDPIPASIGVVSSIDSEYFPFVSALRLDSVAVVSYSLKNSGLGPAVIQNFLVFEDDEKIHDAM